MARWLVGAAAMACSFSAISQEAPHSIEPVAFGGEYRLRADNYDHPDFGTRNAASFTTWQQRFLLGMDVHATQRLRAYLQLGADIEHGRLPASRPADHSHADVAQLFVEGTLGPADGAWRLRIGRQEVMQGRYIAVRDVTNIRRTFDGVRVDGPVAGWTLTALAAHATRNKPGAFDDDPDPGDRLAIISGEHVLPWSGLKIGTAFLGRTNDAARFVPGPGSDFRRTAGLRVFGGRDQWDVDAQASYQFGSFKPFGKPSERIDAWGAAMEAGYSAPLPLNTRIAVRIDCAEGDSSPGDRRLRTFDLPYPNLSYLNDAGVFAPRNVHDVQPFVSVKPSSSFTGTVGTQFLWRNTAQDAVYSPVNTVVVPTGGQGHYVATLPYVRFAWEVVKHVTLQGGWVYGVPGAAYRSAHAHNDLDYAFASLTARF